MSTENEEPSFHINNPIDQPPLEQASYGNEMPPNEESLGNGKEDLLEQNEQNELEAPEDPEIQDQRDTIYNDFKNFPLYKWTPYEDKERCPPSSYMDLRDLETCE